MIRLLLLLALLTPGIAHADPFTFVSFIAYLAGASPWIVAAIAVVGAVYGDTSARRKKRAMESKAKNDYNASLLDRSVTAISALPPWRIVYGRCITGGDIVSIFTSDKSAIDDNGLAYVKPDCLKHLVVHIATHQSQAMNEVFIDGVPIGLATLDVNGWSTVQPFATTRPTGRRVSFTNTVTVSDPVVTILNAYRQGSSTDVGPSPVTINLSNGNRTLTTADGGDAVVDFMVNVTRSTVRFSYHLGTDTQTADAYLVGAVPAQWTTDHRLRGLTYGVLTVDLEDARFQGGPPGPTFDITGRLLYDTRTATTAYSTNNALVIRDWLAAPWGFECAAGDIDDAFTNAAANACDVAASFATNTLVDGIRYDFQGSANGWTVAGQSLTTGADSVTLTSAGGDPQFISPAISVAGSTFRHVRARIRRMGGPGGWDGQCYYSTSLHGFSGTFVKDIGDPGLAVGVWTEVDWDMGNLTAGGSDWTTHTITGIRLDLGANTADVFEVDWVVIQQVTPSTVSEATYTCNGVITTDQAKESMLEDLCESMAGFAVYGAKWQIIAGAWTASVMDLGDDDLDGQIEIVQAGASNDEIFNSVRGTYIASDSATPSDLNLYQNETFVAADGQALWTDVTLPFTCNTSRGKNLQRIFTERSRSSLVITFPAKLKAWPLQVGDRVRVTNTEYGFASKYFRVTDWQFGVTVPVTLTLQEDDSTIWDAADAATADPTPNTNLPDPFVVSAISGLTMASGTTHLIKGLDGTITPRVYVTWTAITDAYVMQSPGRIELKWRRQGNVTWDNQLIAAESTSAYITGVREGDYLTVEIRAINALGQIGPSAFAAHIVVGKTQPPANVSGLVELITGSGVKLSWAQNTELDYDNTELRVGSTWALGTLLFKGAATTWTWPFPALGSYSVWAKHFDTTGHESLTETLVGVTVDASAQVQWGNIAGRPKVFRVVSRGFSDTQSPVAPSIYDGDTGASIFGVQYERSYMMARIRRADGVITFSRQYDVWGEGAAGGFSAATLVTDLNSTANTHLVVIFTYDEPQTNRLTSGLPAAMYRCGASQGVFGSPQFQTRAAYILVGIGGCGESNGFEAYSGSVPNDTNAWTELTISLQNGNFTIGGNSASPRTLRDFSYTGDLNASSDLTLISSFGALSIIGNTVTKTGGSSAWDTSAVSKEGYTGGAYAQGIVASADTMFGLNADPATDGGFISIDYAILPSGNGNVYAYESGTGTIISSSWASGDALAVTYDGAKVRYFQNGTQLREVAVASGIKFFLDTSIYAVGGAIRNLGFGPMSPVTNIDTVQITDQAATELFQDTYDFAGAINGTNGSFVTMRTFTVTPVGSGTCHVVASLGNANCIPDSGLSIWWAVSVGGGADVVMGGCDSTSGARQISVLDYSFAVSGGVSLAFKIMSFHANGVLLTTRQSFYASSFTATVIKK